MQPIMDLLDDPSDKLHATSSERPNVPIVVRKHESTSDERIWKNALGAPEENADKIKLQLGKDTGSICYADAWSKNSSRTRQFLNHELIRERPQELEHQVSPREQQINQSIGFVDEDEHGLKRSLRKIISYLIGVTSKAFSLIEFPLSTLLSIWILAISLNALYAPIRSCFSPLCNLPVVSGTRICSSVDVGHGSHSVPTHAEYPAMVEIQNKAFEQLLDESAGGSSLALEIKKAQMATADLIIVVRTSDIKSRDHLADSLENFVQAAQKTARGLQKLNAKVTGSVDNILAISDYVLRTIEDTDNKRKTSLINFIFSSDTKNNELLATAFTKSLSVLEKSLARVSLVAENSLQDLDELEEQLLSINDIVQRENETLIVERSELLAQLWTILGGNRARIQRFESNLSILSELGSYRKRARAHVANAYQALQALSADVEDLRERAAAPELSGDEIPMEVHALAIRSGVQRLKQDRLRAKERQKEAARRILNVEDDDF